MIRHLFKLAWNRKRANLLVMIEIFTAFIVLFAVVSFGVYYLDNYRRPLGFSYENVWNIEIDMKQTTDDTWTPEMVEKARQIQLALRDAPEVAASAGILAAPYSFSSSNSETEYNGREVWFENVETTDTLPDVLGMEVVRGRWFGREDDGANLPPVVVNQYVVDALFEGEDPIGKVLEADEPGNARRIVGVVEAFRKDGEFSAPGGVIFRRSVPGDVRDRPVRNLLIRVQPGTTAAFEEQLARRLQGVAGDWSFEFDSLEEMRETSFRFSLAPLVVAALVGGFLMLMVALGLTGVMWQSVTQRRPEIGLRRVQGATRGDIYRQIVGELLVVATIALAAGTVVLLQLPVLEMTGSVTAGVFTTSIAISLGLVYLLTVLCALYPSWLATRVRPVEALRYE